MTQSNLGDFGGGVEDTDESEETTTKRTEEGTKMSRFQRALADAPEGAEPFDDLSCPWCFGSKSDFVIKTDDDVIGRLPTDKQRQVSCGHCNAVIPVDAEWYLNGKKIPRQS